jgi:glycerophosphoryl diester phosphodiesterase
MHSQIAFSSFHHSYYHEVKKYNHMKIEFGFIWDDGCKLSDVIIENVECTVNIWQGHATHEFVRYAHEKGVGVLVWFKMCDAESDEIYDNLFTFGVDVICSNYPDKVLSARDRYFNNNINR